LKSKIQRPAETVIQSNPDHSGDSIPPRVIAATQRLQITERTPFFIFDLDRLRRNFRGFTDPWRFAFPRIQIAYSYKTNSLKAITRSLLAEGASADVASGAELSMALGDGHLPDRIFFNGPAKLAAELEHAIRLGVRINVDSIAELIELIRVHRVHRLKPRIGLRVSVVGTDGTTSRLGLDEIELAEALALLSDAALAPSGVHCHVGSNINSIDPYVGCLRRYRTFIRELVNTTQDRGNWIDIGGGFPPQLVGAHSAPLPISDFATSIHQFFQSEGLAPDKFELVLEPGRVLVEECGYFVMRIVATKTRGNRRLLVVDGGTNWIRHVFDWTHPVTVLSTIDTHSDLVEYRVYGTNCFEEDVVVESVFAPANVQVGDCVVVGSVGGYDISSAIVWTRPLPAVIGFDGDGVTTIRRAHDHLDMRTHQN